GRRAPINRRAKMHRTPVISRGSHGGGEFCSGLNLAHACFQTFHLLPASLPDFSCTAHLLPDLSAGPHPSHACGALFGLRAKFLSIGCRTRTIVHGSLSVLSETSCMFSFTIHSFLVH